jgi:L-asparaginase
MTKRVLLLATKDTMAYSNRPGREAVASGADLLDTVPAALLTADVSVEDVPAEPSWDMSPATMLALARRARAAVLEDGYDGVVVTHGTDTLEDTAFLTDLLAGPAAARGGIVFTGAIRYLDDLSADGPRNLASAITAAADPTLRGAGVVACLNDDLHAARWVTKVDATSIAAFSSAPFPLLGRVRAGRVETVAVPPSRPPEPPAEPESDVTLIKTYPGLDPALLTTAADLGARGIVLEGTGMANVPASLLTTIFELTASDIPVVVTSRCRIRDASLEDLSLGGRLAAQLGAMGWRGLGPTKARGGLLVALGSGGGVMAARDWFRDL